MNEEEEYDLKKSMEKLGPLVPVLRDVHGNVIDGIHRLKENPNCPSITVETVSDPVQLVLARMATNVCRRIVPAEEKTGWLKQLVDVTGWTPKRIAEETGMSYTWVMKYIPYEFKDKEKAEAGKIGGLESATRRVAKPLVECHRCHMGTHEAEEYKGAVLCPSCLEEAKRKPMRIMREPEVPAIQVKTYKPKDTWEQRKAQMQVPVSHMEQRLAEMLTKAGVAFESQVEYCIAKCIPDFVINGKAFFIDYEKLHVKREDKDEEARSRLARFHNVEPVGLPYKADTEAETERLYHRIMEKIS